jgi:hypothetical protein
VGAFEASLGSPDRSREVVRVPTVVNHQKEQFVNDAVVNLGAGSALKTTGELR